MTHTFAYLAIPKAAWNYIAEAMSSAGYDHHMITEINGRPTVTIPLDGIGVFPDGDQDQFVNSQRLTDLMELISEAAFRAGYQACKKGLNEESALDRYSIPDEILEIQEHL